MASFIVGVTFARGTPADVPSWGGLAFQSVSDFASQGYWTGPLPEIALAPSSFVQLWVARGGGGANATTLQGVAVTISRETEASLVETDGGLVPLFTPVDLDAQDAILGIVP